VGSGAVHVAVVTSVVVLTLAAAHNVTGVPPFSTQLKATVPEGLVEPANGVTPGVIVAVKVTAWFTVEGEGNPATAVVVAVELTVTCVGVTVALEAKFVSPEYVATTWSVVATRNGAEHLAVVVPLEVLTVTGAHRFTGVVTVLLV